MVIDRLPCVCSPSFRPRLLSAAAAAMILAGVAAAPARAQISDRPLAPGTIMETLRDQGFDDFSRPRRDGTVYRLDATSRRGERVSLVVDAYDGMILERAWRDRDEGLLPPRDVGRPGREMFGALPEVRGYDPRNDYGARPLEAIPEDEPLSADLDDLPPVPGSVDRIPLAAPPTESLRSIEPGQPPLLGAEPQQRDALRTQPPLRSNPLALPDAPPPTSSPAERRVSPGTTPVRPTPPVAAVPPAPKPNVGTSSPSIPPVGEGAATATAGPAPGRKVRIIGGVTPVLPRETSEGSKPN